jgi:Fe-S-cluster-containing dehydrogenase component
MPPLTPGTGLPHDPEALRDEFPDGATEPPDPLTRRRFLALSAASAALAGLGGCARPPREEIVPYVRAPEGVVPGKPLFYATAMTLGGVATGLLVEQHLGRPTKVEGNPGHPASLGATDAFAQAAVLTLYDPDRSTAVMHGDRASSRGEAVGALRAALASRKKGAGLRVLTEVVTSPTLARQLELFLQEYPEARWHQYEPVGRSAVREGARKAFGTDVDAVYHLDKSDVILSLDADFLGAGPGHLRYARDFAERRRVWPQEPSEARMCRLYTVGPTPMPTAAVADHHLSIRASEVESIARAVAVRLGVPTGPAAPAPDGRFPEDWLTGLVTDLQKNRGRGLVIAGDHQPASVHALAHALNDSLGNTGQTITYIPPVHARPVDEMASLRDLVEDMKQGRVEVLVVLGVNPAFTAPADLEFARHLVGVPFRLHLGLYRDETAQLCHWHVSEAHFLESWGDARAYDGTASVVQPLIAPLYGGLSALELVAAIRGQDPSAYELLREFWRDQWKNPPEGFDRLWDKTLHDGVVEGTAFKPTKVELKANWWEDGTPQPSGLEVVFRPDPTVHDGRFANNGWLQELPKPLTKITWDAVAAVGPATARELGLTQEVDDRGGDVAVDLVELRYRGRSVEAPAWVLPGHAEGSVTVYFGYGRAAAGRAGSGVGFNGYAIRTSDRPWFDAGLEVRRTGRRYRLAATQLHHALHGRDPVRSGTLQHYRENPHAIAGRRSLPIVGEPPSLYPEHSYPHYKWGMVIDLSACVGCSACVVACQAENNIPVVGKEQVARGREMHWLRIDSYHADDPAGTYFQPVPCMHCEKAPCEVVCPVNATVHSDEGLNDMVYNRCVGTRYCSNNCPYKVRRFNFLRYADWTTESLKLLRNPAVTVRSVGVMEKCTYCVQRINAARVHAETDDRSLVRNREGALVKPIHEHELLTACQAACPTRAIAFGDLNDPGSTVSRMRHDAPLNYGLLADELGTRPRTTYLAAVRNPNPDIKTR